MALTRGHIWPIIRLAKERSEALKLGGEEKRLVKLGSKRPMTAEDTIGINYSPSNAPKSAKGQRARILRLLIDARGSWVPLPEILALGIAQYGARILELRRLGFVIENKIESVNGARYSRFRLLSSPAPAESPAVVTPASSPATSSPSADWYERQTGHKRPSAKPSDELPFGSSLIDMREN